MDIGLALGQKCDTLMGGAYNLVQRAQNMDDEVEGDDSDGEFEGRKRPQKKVGSIEALLKKQESARSSRTYDGHDADAPQLYSADMIRRAQEKLKAKPAITCCLYETNMQIAAQHQG
jgi:hypothetical protein